MGIYKQVEHFLFRVEKNTKKFIWKKTNRNIFKKVQKSTRVLLGWVIRVAVKSFNIDEYEDSWLAFLFLGLPANENCRDSLKSGQAVRDANSQSALAQSKKIRTGGGTTPDSASKEAAAVPIITHIHKVTVSTEELEYLQIQTKTMNSNLIVLNSNTGDSLFRLTIPIISETGH